MSAMQSFLGAELKEPLIISQALTPSLLSSCWVGAAPAAWNVLGFESFERKACLALSTALLLVIMLMEVREFVNFIMLITARDLLNFIMLMFTDTEEFLSLPVWLSSLVFLVSSSVMVMPSLMLLVSSSLLL